MQRLITSNNAKEMGWWTMDHSISTMDHLIKDSRTVLHSVDGILRFSRRLLQHIHNIQWSMFLVEFEIEMTPAWYSTEQFAADDKVQTIVDPIGRPVTVRSLNQSPRRFTRNWAGEETDLRWHRSETYIAKIPIVLDFAIIKYEAENFSKLFFWWSWRSRSN